MAIEIERKFLVNRDKLPALAGGQLIQQAYIPTSNSATVRVRLAGEKAWLAVKSPAVNLARYEFEYAIPVVDARMMLNTVCSPNLLEKHRHLLQVNGMTWEVDVFCGSNAGLIVAEVELTREDQQVELPDWAGQEVTRDRRYSNYNLSRSPFSEWDICPGSNGELPA